jgi:hypothetical protein
MIKNLIDNVVWQRPPPNSYYQKEYNSQIPPQHYRTFVGGGDFDEIGTQHLTIVKKYGLTQDMKFIDIGCGALRSGVKIIDYLDPFNYYGIDVNTSILHAGYNNELLNYGVTDKVTEDNFSITDNFELEQFYTQFDMGLAQSLFTHLPINHLHYCLIKIAPFFKSGGKFFATFWFCDEEDDITRTKKFQSDVTVYTNLIYDIYHIKRSQLSHMMKLDELARLWDIEYLPDSHPRLQNWVVFSRK